MTVTNQAGGPPGSPTPKTSAPSAPRAAKVTIKTLAQALGVSPATVSNAYNKPDQLSEDLRVKILAKADELGYGGPSAAGRSLRSGKANAFGVMFVGRLSYAFYDPFAAVFLCGLAGAVEETGMSISLLPVLGTAEQPDITSVRQANIDGLVTMCVGLDHPAVQLMRSRGLPVVSTDISDDPDAYWVAIDDEAAGAQLGDHLAELGHRDVAVVVDTHRPASSEAYLSRPELVLEPDSRARLTGLIRAMPEARVSVIAAGHNAIESGRIAGGFALDGDLGTGRRPSAVVGLSDVLGLGVLEALRSRGLRPGTDVSVCGFDDVPAAAEAELTTIRQPIDGKGRQVGEMLLDPGTGPRQVLLPHELVVRTSTGPVRA